MTVNERTRQFVRQRANYLCEYCHSPESSRSDIFTIDHLILRSLGGSDAYDNLALACRRCNERRYNFTTGTDPQTKEETAIFNPRLQRWSDHYQGFIQESRHLWIQGGWHPPEDAPCQK